MIKTAWISGLLVAVLAAVLVGCGQPEDPANLHTRCEGADKVFILDDPDKGSSLYVVPDHRECA